MSGLFARPAAALSSGLLARKGQARPAMRAQNPVGFGMAGALDDLGWNDMGGPVPPSASPSVQAPAPPVLAEREELHRALAATGGGGPKAAFTLRLDADRHLRLRLASASANRSAQALVTDALDALLARMPEVETLAAQLPHPAGKAA